MVNCDWQLFFIQAEIDSNLYYNSVYSHVMFIHISSMQSNRISSISLLHSQVWYSSTLSFPLNQLIAWSQKAFLLVNVCLARLSFLLGAWSAPKWGMPRGSSFFFPDSHAWISIYVWTSTLKWLCQIWLGGE